MSGSQFADVPPHDLTAEQAVVGAMMLSRDAITDVRPIIGPDAHYRAAHQVIHETVLELDDAGAPADVIAVADRLTARRLLGKVGGGPYLHTCIAVVPTVANAAYYAQIVRAKAVARRIIEVGLQLDQIGWAEGLDTPEQYDEAYARLAALAALITPPRAADLADLLPGALDAIEAGQGTASGLASGWEALDRLTGGLRAGLTVVAARPSVGKSVVLLNVAVHVALGGTRVLVVSLEQNRQQCLERIISAEARVDLSRIRDRALTDPDWDKVAPAVYKLAGAPLRINDDPYATLPAIRAELRLMARAGDPAGLLVLDYLNLMGGHADSREREIAGLSRGLKLLGEELGIPVVVGAQLNRGPEMRADHRPLLADLRDSGTVEQDADVVILLYRPGMYDEGAGYGHLADRREEPQRADRHGGPGVPRLARPVRRDRVDSGRVDPAGSPGSD